MSWLGEVGPALRLGEFLDGVAQHGAGHGLVAGLQVSLQSRLVAFSRFAEEPADGFVDEVVGVVQEDVRDGEGVAELPVADEGHGADDADALLPEGLAVAREVVEERAVAIEEPFPEEGVAAQVHEVPVVDAVGVGEVELDARLLQRRRLFCVPEHLHQRQQGGEAHFVKFARDAFLEVLEGRLAPAVADHRARHGDLDSQELIPFAVLPGPGLEKPRQPGHLPRVRLRPHLCQKDIHTHWHKYNK